MISIKKITAVFLIFTFFVFSGRALAADAMEVTLKDTAYGGIIGALIGSAFVLLADKPGDHLDYIPTGAGLGMIAGAIYGITTASSSKSFSEIENGKFSMHVPTIKVSAMRDKTVDAKETATSVGLFAYKF
ncbi:MAG: hypothetical protein HZB82_03040 [Deltaproteobacteria bacterium]|nr:hypothetical protein [Deltaproteobacteria bacterium]